VKKQKKPKTEMSLQNIMSLALCTSLALCIGCMEVAMAWAPNIVPARTLLPPRAAVCLGQTYRAISLLLPMPAKKEEGRGTKCS